MICVCLWIVGCGEYSIESNKEALSLVEPVPGHACLDDIPVPKYRVRVVDERGEEETMEFAWPWYVAIGGRIQNEAAVFERAAAGQVDQSMVLGMATRKYFMWSGYRAKALSVAMRDQFDWNEIRKVLMEVAGEGSILTRVTPLPPQIIESQVLRQGIPPEFFITGGLTEVTVGERSGATGFTFAGVGASRKVVQTSVAGSIEITDPYTGELLVVVMGQNIVTAVQLGTQAFRIVSFGSDEEYLKIELTTAREMIKQQVQVELVDYLFYKAFKKLADSRPEYLATRLHARVGRIQGYAQELAAVKGFKVIEAATPIPFAISQDSKGTEDANSIDTADQSDEQAEITTPDTENLSGRDDIVAPDVNDVVFDANRVVVPDSKEPEIFEIHTIDMHDTNDVMLPDSNEVFMPDVNDVSKYDPNYPTIPEPNTAAAPDTNDLIVPDANEIVIPSPYDITFMFDLPDSTTEVIQDANDFIVRGPEDSNDPNSIAIPDSNDVILPDSNDIAIIDPNDACLPDSNKAMPADPNDAVISEWDILVDPNSVGTVDPNNVIEPDPNDATDSNSIAMPDANDFVVPDSNDPNNQAFNDDSILSSYISGGAAGIMGLCTLPFFVHRIPRRKRSG